MDDDDRPASKAGMMGPSSPTRCSPKTLLWWCHNACQSWLTDHDTREAKVENTQQADSSTLNIRHSFCNAPTTSGLSPRSFMDGLLRRVDGTELSRQDKSAGVMIPSHQPRALGR